MRGLFLVGLLVACHREPPQAEIPAPVITLDAPTYGAFLGDGPIHVSGTVSPLVATVRVDDLLVDVDQATGHFEADVDFAGARYHNVDVQAAHGPHVARTRVPVFDGGDPIDQWPGGVTLRLTPEGMARLGENLGTIVDSTGWDTTLAGSLPAIETDAFSLVPVGITHSPTVVELLPAVDGIDTRVAFRDVVIGYTLGVDLFGTWFEAPVDVGFGRIAVGAIATPDVDDAGMLSLSLGEAIVDMDDPTIEIAGFDGWILSLLIGLVSDALIEPIGELLVDLVLGGIGTLPLGGPYAFQTDLMGTTVDAKLTDAYGDLKGVGAGIGVGFDEAVPDGPLAVPAPPGWYDAEPVHAALGLHEALLQRVVIEADLASMLTQDIQLPGVMGELLGAGVRALPGGEGLPSTSEGFCLKLDPVGSSPTGEIAEVARLQTGVAPLAVIYIPDLRVNVATMQSGTCVPWLEANLPAEVGLAVTSGTKVGLDLRFGHGAVLSYATPSPWDEDEVVDALAGWIGGLVGLLGGSFSFDLADLAGLGGGGGTDPLGGALGDIQPQIVGSDPILDEAGEPIPGLYAVQLVLWGD